MNIIVFDTETIDTKERAIYDLAFLVYDTEKKQKLYEINFIIEEVYNNKPLFESAYYANKRPIYEHLLNSGKAIMTKWIYALRHFYHIARLYKVEYITAYNLQFDKGAIEYTTQKFAQKYHVFNHFMDLTKVACLWKNAANTIMQTETFKEYIEANQLYTAKGYRQGTVEIVYNYLHSDDRVQSHTAIDDINQELDILIKILEISKGEIIQGIHSWIFTDYNQDIIVSKKSERLKAL